MSQLPDILTNRAVQVLGIRLTTGEYFHAREWTLEGDWLTFRTRRKFIAGHEYPQRNQRVSVALSCVLWIEEREA